MRPLSFTATLLALTLSLSAAPAAAQPEELGYERDLSFRVLLGGLDGEENSMGLHADSARYTVGLGASAPVALDGRLEANLELWLTERAYDTAVVPAPLDTASNTTTFTAAALTYGLRLQPATGHLRPYAMANFGFQGSRLRTTGRAAGRSDAVEEEIITPTLHVGVGLVWIRGRDAFGIDYRRWFTEGEFRDFGIEDVQLGGEYLGVSLGTRW